jgi:DNA polymerase III alpha subunit
MIAAGVSLFAYVAFVVLLHAVLGWGTIVSLLASLLPALAAFALIGRVASKRLKTLIDTASRMEGGIRNVGTHAAGVIISDAPIIEYLPLHRPTGQNEDLPIKSVAQYDMDGINDLGLLKVDFLGLVTLTIMAKAC